MSNIFSMTIVGKPSTNITDLFEEVEKIKSDDPPAFINIDMNGVVFNAKIYETKEQVTETYLGIVYGDKQRILKSLPSEGEPISIGASLEHINEELEKLGYEVFSFEELKTIVDLYVAKKQLARTR